MNGLNLPLACLVFLAPGVIRAADQPPAASPPTTTMQLIAADDPRFRYEGRIDFTNRAEPVLIWQGSRVSVDCTGSGVVLRFSGATGQNFFNAEVDGTSTIVAASEGHAGLQRIEVPLAPGAGPHHLRLFKRSEAAKGQVRFLGVELPAGAQAWAPEPPAYRLKMEFFGDSITAGACNEDGAADQWDDFRTHNHALSYDHLVSQAFGADHRAMAISGMGIATGYVEIKAGEAWDRLYPRADAPRADLAAWQPDVAFVLLGENDDSFSRNQGHGFPAAYRPGHLALVRAIRAAYPRTQLVLLRGGMFGGSQSAPLREAWTAVVQELEAGDPAVSHFVFKHWSELHPRVSDDRAMAEELTAWLKDQAFMKKFR